MSKDTIEFIASITRPVHALYKSITKEGADYKIYTLISGSIPLIIIVFMILGSLLASPGIATLVIAVIIAFFMSAVADIILSFTFPVLFILVKAALFPIAIIYEYLEEYDK